MIRPFYFRLREAEPLTREVMNARPDTVAATATVEEGAAILRDRKASCLIVVSASGCPVGIVTEAGLRRAAGRAAVLLAPDAEIGAARLPDVTRVCEVMTPVRDSVPQTAPVWFARRMARIAPFGILFVVDEYGALVGAIHGARP